jgi:hypothetical protein
MLGWRNDFFFQRYEQFIKIIISVKISPDACSESVIENSGLEIAEVPSQ